MARYQPPGGRGPQPRGMLPARRQLPPPEPPVRQRALAALLLGALSLIGLAFGLSNLRRGIYVAVLALLFAAAAAEGLRSIRWPSASSVSSTTPVSGAGTAAAGSDGARCCSVRRLVARRRMSQFAPAAARAAVTPISRIATRPTWNPDGPTED